MNTDLGQPTGRIMMRPAVVDHDQSSLVAASCVLVDNLGEETGAGRGFRARCECQPDGFAGVFCANLLFELLQGLSPRFRHHGRDELLNSRLMALAIDQHPKDRRILEKTA